MRPIVKPGVDKLGPIGKSKEIYMYDVVWTTPSEDFSGTMPLGNGEVGVNAWIDPSGDLRFYVARTDCWGDFGRLLKIGAVRVRIGDLSSESDRARVPLENFVQTLAIPEGEMSAIYRRNGNDVRIRLWVDAHRPLIVVEIETSNTTQAAASIELWRTKDETLTSTETSDIFHDRPEPTLVVADTVISGLTDAIGWYHRNALPIGPELCAQIQGVDDFPRSNPLIDRTFGALIWTSSVESNEGLTLTAGPSQKIVFEIAVHTAQTETAQEWIEHIKTILRDAQKIPLSERGTAHESWWSDFSDRSWINIKPNNLKQVQPEVLSDAADPTLYFVTEAIDLKGTASMAGLVDQGYALQRYINACGGRGGYPIKYNGSIFTVPREDKPGNADYRRWGPGYWWQNTRLPYISMCASGDFDLMRPFFKMYALDLMSLASHRTYKYFGHEGAYIPETIYFWGDMITETYGWTPASERSDKLQESPWHKYEWVSGLELVYMMLDYAEFTQDTEFITSTLLPAAHEILTFFDKHYALDENGKLHMHPAQALETWWDCTGPLPEIAGLRATIARLLALPSEMTNSADRNFWSALAAKLPEIPTRIMDGRKMLAPANIFAEKRNYETPELYAVFPFRQYSFEKPDVDFALTALAAREDRGMEGWSQDDIFMAYLGLAGQARSYVVQRAAASDPSQRFPAFWGPNVDWTPDQDHGNVLVKAVQSMILQTDGRAIYLAPAWPQDWDCDFKLHAPYNTTVTGAIVSGNIVSLEVSPPERAKDVVICGPKKPAD